VKYRPCCHGNENLGISAQKLLACDRQHNNTDTCSLHQLVKKYSPDGADPWMIMRLLQNWITSV